MRLGDNSIGVTQVRRLLWRHGRMRDWPEGVGTTTFDADVADAVDEFQRTKKLVVDGIVGPKTLAKLRDFGFQALTPAEASGETALALLATDWLDRDVWEEGGQNRGKEVDEIIRSGGGPVPKSKTTPGEPWCAWFVSALVKDLVRAGHRGVVPPNPGLAVNWYRRVPGSLRMPDGQGMPDGLVPGIVFVRTRQSRPLRDREQAKRGQAVQGHTGVVVEVLPDGFHAIAGNSSGEGHDVGGTGRVALERYTVGSRGWERLVGFGRPMAGATEDVA